MPNMNIPEEERNLTPDQVEALDKRRQWGLTYQVIGGQFAFFAVLLTLWSGQDAQYSPGAMHPMLYYNILTGILAVVFGLYGTYLKRGRPEFSSL
ncbi:hypothetical protein H7849_16920 [Alloacidobacterium dinghuense]|uniref:Uncharacterized protein n=1 Tax=Alloacidobacterium dinghuense TaxID=2763107 RepID=A0A7G8BE21_9BACT|nr:hypothetical protein [Alloacidobacterium dinghuense]QNI30791.1 hypothetical protein H7849_16920 [Alloacidobacterium dinghuense]